MKITAAVVHEKTGPFVVETLELQEPRADELLVRVVASGMCQTDLHGRDGYYGTPFPAVFGHEGAGVVEAVGSAVHKFIPGDHVIMSFPWCGRCPNCLQRRMSYCYEAWDLKMRGKRADGSTLMRWGNAPVYSAFFQQSSFATHAIANERFCVKVRSDAPLDLLGPLACSVQTGAGAVLNSMRPGSGQGFALFGAGAVGLSGLLAARIAGCDPIVVVDIHDRRLALARELGATHTMSHAGRADVVAEIRKLTGGGVHYALETSAVPTVFREAVDVLLPGGTCILVGSARPGVNVVLDMSFLQNGRIVRGVIQGDSEPDAFIPSLVDLMMEGKLPVERMMTFYTLKDIDRAAADSAGGITIKPILRI